METQSILLAQSRYTFPVGVAGSRAGNPQGSDPEVYEGSESIESVDSQLPVVAACSGVAL